MFSLLMILCGRGFILAGVGNGFVGQIPLNSVSSKQVFFHKLEDFLNKMLLFIHNHLNNLLLELKCFFFSQSLNV